MPGKTVDQKHSMPVRTYKTFLPDCDRYSLNFDRSSYRMIEKFDHTAEHCHYKQKFDKFRKLC